MATAEFDAEYIYDAAIARAAEISRKQSKIREPKIDRYMTYRGGFLWLQIKERTRDQATRAYEKGGIDDREGAFWTEFDWGSQMRPSHNIARLAKAAMERRTGIYKPFVTLTAEDCRAIGIPAGFEVPA